MYSKFISLYNLSHYDKNIKNVIDTKIQKLIAEDARLSMLQMTGDGTYTVTVPNDATTTAHQILFITLAVDNTKAISAADIANCKIEIL